MPNYYPIMIDITNRKCIVVGGGKVAERKILSLLEANGDVLVISPDTTEKMNELYHQEKIEIIKRAYTKGDLKEAYLVYVATDKNEVNEACLKEAREEGILINIVDQPDMCDFIVPASIKKGDLNITISTNGKSPMLCRKIRKELELIYNDEYALYIDALGKLRKQVLMDIDDIKTRKEIFRKIVYSNLLEEYKNEKVHDIEKEVMNYYEQMKKVMTK
ncbi:bifunctional precorrin-2 dehydrogenase/sirohydrochlorin ferrochelatase [Lutibacter sp. B2]|nr:bifunctional precorrin-2 dehydrogenase/sirohydrochlorin ferrochelatase [Lutibacter sp. B2]